MNINQLTHLAGAIAVALGITACGGGGGGGTSTVSSLDTSSVGTITGFGSVFVNGVEFDTSEASIRKDGKLVDESELAVGMVVEINGSDDGVNGVALSIDADDELEGMVLANNINPGETSGTLDIMGQTVHVGADLIFESKVTGVSSIDQLAVNHIVEVNGHSDGNGEIYATRLEVKAADLATYLVADPEGVEVKGVVSGLDSASQMFMLGNMTVNYAGAVLDIDSGLVDGVYVEVESVAGIDGSGFLVASKVELENDGDAGHHGDEGEDFEIESVISSDFDGSGFVLDGINVLLTEQTEFEDGNISDLIAGTRVEVEGNFDANGNLLAREIELEDEAEQEIDGVIAFVEATGVNSGTVTLTDGSAITVNNDTMMKDSRDNGMLPVEMFNLTFLSEGDYVEVHVFTDTSSGELVAVKLERDDNI